MSLQACFRAVTLAGRQLVFVLGKGGVGRTTVAASLGIAAAEAGLETLVAEVASQSRLLSLFGHGEDAPQGLETPLRHRLHGLSIDPARALEEYVVLHLPLKALARRLTGDRAFSQLASAAPGLRELVTMGKLWYLAQRRAERAAAYDVVIADLPATGHGLAMLRAPSTFADIANTGPLHRQTSTVAHDLTDPRKTGAVVVALAEELATNEAVGLVGGLRQLRVDPAVAVVNAVAHRLVEDADVRALRRARTRASTGLAGAALAAGLARGAADVRRERELERLEDATGISLTVLPEVDEPTHEGLDELAHDLAHAWVESASKDTAA
jgi:anion-transporting  ArsA/GET3 family ATPase